MIKNRKKQAGFIVTIELLLLATITVIGLIVGMTDVRDSVLAELGDVSEAVGALNQSYNILGVQNVAGTAATQGSVYNDAADLSTAGTVIDTESGTASTGDVVFTAATFDEDAAAITQ